MSATALVQWTYPGTDQSGFLLERSVDSGSTWPLLWPFEKNVYSYLDTAVVANGTYWYRVAATNPKGTGSFTDKVELYIHPLPPDIYTWQSGSSAILFWNYQGISPMEVSRSSDGGVTWTPQTRVALTSGSTYYYFDNSTVTGTTYTYKICDAYVPNSQVYTSSAKTINPVDSTTRLAFVGDTAFESGPYIQWEIHTASLLNMNNMARGKFSASRMLLGGDNAAVGYSWHKGYQGQVFQTLGPTESMWAIMGNHDQSDMGGPLAFRNYFGYKFSQYMWREGCIQGVSILTTSETDNTYLSGNVNWIFLSNSLAQHRNDPAIAWRIVMVHAPVITSNWNHPGNPTLKAIPWAEWGVDAVFSGHNHAVERLESGSTAFIVCGGGSNEKPPYYLRAGSPYSKWYNVDKDDGNGPYNNGYVFTLIEANALCMSMSFYSGSNKLADTGSTNILGATMAGNSLVLRHLPPLAVPTLSSTATSI